MNQVPSGPQGLRVRLLRWVYRREWVWYGWSGAVWCFFNGEHTPERDQCGKPEHDFCSICGKSMPNQWPGSYVAPKALRRSA